MKQVLNLLFVSGIFAATTFATTTYVIDNSTNAKVYSVANTGGAATLITSFGAGYTTLADYGNVLYSIDPALNNNLSSYNLATGVETSIGAIGGSAVLGLTADALGNLWAVTATSIEHFTRSATGLVSVAATYNTPGDLQFIGSTLYVTVFNGTDYVLETLNTSTGAVVSTVGSTPFLGTTPTVGLAYSTDVGSAGTLYATTGSTIFSVSTSSQSLGAANAITGTTGTIIDAASDAVPEPATFGIIGLGLIGLSSLAYRRRKS